MGQFVVAVKRVGDEDVVDPRFGHAERPFDCPHLDAASACGDLHPGDLRAFMDLRMGTEPYACIPGELRHRGDIRLQNIEVDNDGGGGELTDRCSWFGHDILPDEYSVLCGC